MPDDTEKKPDEGNVVDLQGRKPAEPTMKESVPAEGAAPAMKGHVAPTAEAAGMQQQMVAHLAGMIAPFCPNMDEQALLRLAAEGLEEQAQIHEQIMPTLMAGNPFLKSHPALRLAVKGPNGKEGAVIGPKRLEDVDDAQPAITQAMLVAILLTPSTRMVLKAWGFQIGFEQVAQDVSKPAPTIHRV
jgi:hypothetical protein